MTPTRRRVAGVGALVLGVLWVVVAFAGLAASPAGAHSELGKFQLQPTSEPKPLTVDYRIRLIYENDTHPVTQGATVTVSGTGPAGVAVGPVALAYTGTDGYYAGSVTFPVAGAWRMVFTAQNPKAEYIHNQAVSPVPTTAPPTTVPSPTPRPTVTAAPPTTAGAAPTTTAAPDASGAPTTATTAPATDGSTPGTTAAPTSGSTPGTTPAADTSADDESAQVQISDGADGGSSNVVPIVAGAGIAVLAVAGGLALFARKGAGDA